MSPTKIESEGKLVKSIPDGASPGFFTPGRRVSRWAKAVHGKLGHLVAEPSTRPTDVMGERDRGLTAYVGPFSPGPHNLGLTYTARWVPKDQE